MVCATHRLSGARKVSVSRERRMGGVRGGCIDGGGGLGYTGS